jgi:hypothetical protein
LLGLVDDRNSLEAKVPVVLSVLEHHVWLLYFV